MARLLLLLLLLLATSDASLRKCCARDELLSWDGAAQGFVCGAREVDAHPHEEEDMLRDEHAWLPRAAVRFQDATDKEEEGGVDAERVNAFLVSSQVQYDARPACAVHAQDTLMQYAGSERDEFSLVAMNDGQMSLEVLKESSLHNPSVAHAQLFPASSFCVDSTADEGAHAVLLCPCSELTPCVRKCCADSYAFAHRGATVAPRCESVVRLPYTVYDWLPGIANDTADSVRYYRLTQAQPECARKMLHVSKNQVHEEAKFYLLPGGSIKAVDSGHVYPTDSYCGEFTTRNDELVYYCADADVDGASVRGALLTVGACAFAAALAILLAGRDKPISVFGCVLVVHVAMATLSLAARAALELLVPGQLNHAASAALGLCAQFCALSASFWLASLAADVASVLGGVPGRGSWVPCSGRPLLGYAVLTWAVATLATAGAVIAEFTPSLTADALRPRFGRPDAYFNGRGATWMFLYGPNAAAAALAFCLALFAHVSLRRRRQRRGVAGGGGGGYQLALPDDGIVASADADRLRTLTWLVAVNTATCALELGSYCAWPTPSSHWLVSGACALLSGVATLLVAACYRRAPATLRRALATLRSADKMAARGFQHGRLELQDLD